MLALIFAIGFTLPLRILLRIAGRVFDIAHSLLRFAFQLLRGSLNLSIGIARPFSNLAFCAARGIVYCAFYYVFIHDLFPPPWIFRVGHL